MRCMLKQVIFWFVSACTRWVSLVVWKNEIKFEPLLIFDISSKVGGKTFKIISELLNNVSMDSTISAPASLNWSSEINDFFPAWDSTFTVNPDFINSFTVAGVAATLGSNSWISLSIYTIINVFFTSSCKNQHKINTGSTHIHPEILE